jgi:diacylglycerol kinase family enzyme
MFSCVSRSSHSYAFLVNPVSGSGKGLAILQNLPQMLEEFGLSGDAWTLETTKAKGLREQVAALLASHDRLIVAGGDGTVGQALEGALEAERPDAAVGFFPLGTGNDMAQELKLVRTFKWHGTKALLSAFLKDQTTEIDLWDVNGKVVLANYLSVGLDAAVARRFSQYRARNAIRSVTWNKLYYIKAGLSNLGTRLEDFRVEVGTQGHTSVDLSGSCSVLFLNISSYAGGTLRSPGTRPDDGRLSILPIPSLMHYLALAPGSVFAPLARASARAFLPAWHTDAIHARWKGEIPLQVDGEPRPDLGSEGRLDIVRKGRVRILLGPRRPWFTRGT